GAGVDGADLFPGALICDSEPLLTFRPAVVGSPAVSARSDCCASCSVIGVSREPVPKTSAKRCVSDLGGGCSRQVAGCVTGTVPSGSGLSLSLSMNLGNGNCSPAKRVPSCIVPRWNGPAPSTHISLEVLIACATPDCQTIWPVWRL